MSERTTAEPTSPGAAPALEVAGLRVSFRAHGYRADWVPVLRGLDLTVHAGECVAVVGPSGAGKSVLARALLGLAGEGGAPARVEAERLAIAGRDLAGGSERSWRTVRGRSVGLVLQDALGSLDPLRTVGAEVAEALRPRLGHGWRAGGTRGGVLPTAGLRASGPGASGPGARATTSRRVLDALALAGLAEPELVARQRSGELSGGMRQRALIASAIVTAPPLLVLDEPTTALDATVASGVLSLLASLRDRGTALLLVTHDLGAVARVADRVVVIAQGRAVEEGSTPQVLTHPRHEVTRGLLDALPRGAKPPAPARAGSAVVLEARRVHRSYPVPGGVRHAVDGVDLVVRAGEALGVVGESGSGKSTLARLLLAAERPDAGSVLLDGEDWSGLGERERRARRSRIRLVPQDPLGAMDPRRTVERILRDAGAPDAAAAVALLRRVHLESETLQRMPRSLSGGQRQRVAIARALASSPEILVLDEPVSALDVTVQAGILELLRELQATGSALVLVSHDLAVVRSTCDRVAVMSAGRVVETGPVEEVWAEPRHEVTRALLDAATAPLP